MPVLEDLAEVFSDSFEYKLLINKSYLEITYWLGLDTNGMS